MAANKKKGFTLVEMIIVMTLSIIVVGVIFTFFIQGKKMTTQTEVKSDMQREASNAQESIMKIGSQADSLNTLVESGGSNITLNNVQAYKLYWKNHKGPIKDSGSVIYPVGYASVRGFSFDLPKGLSIYNITVGDAENLRCTYTIDADKKLQCKVELVSGSTTTVKKTLTICENVDIIYVKPVNWENLKSKITDSSYEFYPNVTGLKVTINFKLSRGFSKDVPYSIDTIVKFRNQGRDNN